MILQSTTEIVGPATRIVSLVPSITELLLHLGLADKLVGVTKFCPQPLRPYPPVKTIGGTKNLHLAEIIDLQPDLVIANKEENEKTSVLALAEIFPVWVTDVNTLEDALQMISDLGLLTGTRIAAEAICEQINAGFTALQKNIPTEKIKAAYLIWQDPIMTVGGDNFINNMLEKAGFENVFSGQMRYPEISMNDIITSGCEQLLLSSEPYPFAEKHLDFYRDQLPGMEGRLVDGAMFSWYGSKLLQSAAYFKDLRKEEQ